MTDSWLMEADCVHGLAWYECQECAEGEQRPHGLERDPADDDPFEGF